MHLQNRWGEFIPHWLNAVTFTLVSSHFNRNPHDYPKKKAENCFVWKWRLCELCFIVTTLLIVDKFLLMWPCR